MLKWCFKNISHPESFMKLQNIWSCKLLKAARIFPFFRRSALQYCFSRLFMGQENEASKQVDVGDNSILCQFNPNQLV